MSNITNLLGARIRNYRTRQGLSQEKLAELSGCHPTYIGQIESIEKIAIALNIPLSTLFDKLSNNNDTNQCISNKCYEFLLTKTKAEQERLFDILLEIDQYKNS